MAKFIGHLVPGTLFSLLGTWWMYNVWMKYFLCRRDAATKSRNNTCIRYTNTAVFPCPCSRKIPLEGFFKATIVPIGMLAEYLTGFEDGKFVSYKNIQHLTMYFFFGLNGVVDILTFYRLPLPSGFDYASAILGFAMEALLFTFHLHGRSHVDSQMHILLLCAIIGCLTMTMAETVLRQSVLIALARCYFIVLQGTWLLQMAYLLYWPSGTTWQNDDHDNLMLVTVFFCWHCAGGFIFTTLVGLFISWRVKQLTSTSRYMTLHSLKQPTDNHVGLFDTEQIRPIMVDSADDDVL